MKFLFSLRTPSVGLVLFYDGTCNINSSKYDFPNDTGLKRTVKCLHLRKFGTMKSLL